MYIYFSAENRGGPSNSVANTSPILYVVSLEERDTAVAYC